MGMFDTIWIKGDRARKLALDVGIDIEQPIQTKELKNVMTHYIIEDDGLYELEYIHEPTGNTVTTLGFEREEMRTIGERIRHTNLFGELSFTAYSVNKQYERYTATFQKSQSNNIYLLDIREGNSSICLNTGDWIETYYENPGPAS